MQYSEHVLKAEKRQCEDKLTALAIDRDVLAPMESTAEIAREKISDTEFKIVTQAEALKSIKQQMAALDRRLAVIENLLRECEQE